MIKALQLDFNCTTHGLKIVIMQVLPQGPDDLFMLCQQNVGFLTLGWGPWCSCHHAGLVIRFFQTHKIPLERGDQEKFALKQETVPADMAAAAMPYLLKHFYQTLYVLLREKNSFHQSRIHNTDCTNMFYAYTVVIFQLSRHHSF